MLPHTYLTLPGAGRVAFQDEGPHGAGSGPTLIFIHGLASHRTSWKRLLPYLIPHARCLWLDLPGYGDSDAGPFPSTVVFYSEVILQFMDALQLEQASLVGHSMGGQIALMLALRAAYRVQRLVLAAPAGLESFTPEQQQLLLLQGHGLPYSAGMGSMWQHMGVFSSSDVLYFSSLHAYALTLRRSLASMLSEPVLPYLAQLTTPTLVLLGEQDRLIPSPIFNTMAQDAFLRKVLAPMPKARFRIIPDAGHFLPYDAAGAMAAAMLPFLGIKP